MVKVSPSCDASHSTQGRAPKVDVISGPHIDFINETAIQIHRRSSDTKKANHFLASSATDDQVYILKRGGEGGKSRSIKEMATDESVVVSSGDSTPINIVDSSNQAASATPDVEGVVASEETLPPVAQSPPPTEADSMTSDGGGGGVVEEDEVAVFQSNNKITTNNIITKGVTPSATAPIPQMLPNTVIAVVQPTTRTNSNYVRINTIPAKAREQHPSHYVAVPAQRVVVAATSGQQQQQSHSHCSGTATKQHHSQGSRRLAQQVSYGPGITIHHCQPGPGGGGPSVGGATMSAQPVWPIVDPVFHFGAGFEPPSRPYCPTHEPQPQEHVVMFHVHPGVSVSFQIGGNQEIVRGKWRI